MEDTHVVVTREDNDPIDSMREWSDEKKLDEVLRELSMFYFRNDDNDGFIPYTQLRNYLDKRSITYSESLSMVLYLSRDNKIDIIPKDDSLQGTPPTKIRLNFEGHKFMWAKGYVGKRKSNEVEIRYKNWTTISLIFGGVAAGLYYTVELLKMIPFDFCNY